MTVPDTAVADPWVTPALVAALLAVDPVGLGGVALRARAGGARDQWQQLLRRLLPAGLPLRRIPLHVDDSRLLGGLDLAATLRAGRPVAQQGLLAQTDGGVALLASAERLSASTAARLAQVHDSGEVALERNGMSLRSPARLGLVALDEGCSDEEQLPAALLDRLAFHLQIDDTLAGETASLEDLWLPDDIVAARRLVPQVRASDAVLQALCGTAWALGVSSLRAPLLALRAARAVAALDGRSEVSPEDCSLAAGLVLAPRATQLPQTSADEETPSSAQEPDQPAQAEPPADQAPPDPAPAPDDPALRTEPTDQELEDIVLEAAQAAIPAGLLAALQFGRANRERAQSASGSGAQRTSKARGRPLAARRGELVAGTRLNLIETLRAAAPWQKLRRQEAAQPASAPRVQVRREDFHVSRFKQRRETTTIFVVDASGSAALHRLAEAKGAVELLLADCYVRRDRVAVLAFRGKTADLLLPPTRSLVRAKRSLAGLPGGGGTPLACGLDAARALALACIRRGETPIVVLLTDGRANIARDGMPGRDRATQDALHAACLLRAAAVTALLLDTSPQPQPAGRELAQAMGAAYLPLPYAGSAAMSQAVRFATAPSPAR